MRDTVLCSLCDSTRLARVEESARQVKWECLNCGHEVFRPLTKRPGIEALSAEVRNA